MVEKFDPYHRWLGIAPDEQPADLYRLLGLRRFESDPEVIRDGAERQIAHVRRYDLGQYAELAHPILYQGAEALFYGVSDTCCSRRCSAGLLVGW